MNLKVKKLDPKAVVPKYSISGDAGMDLFSVEYVVIKPGQRYAVATGLAIEFDPGYVALVWDKSGIALKKGIKTMGGVIEHTYRGEYKIIMVNLSDEDYKILKGDKIAQLLIQPIVTATIEEVAELSDSERGVGAFGSTGIK